MSKITSKAQLETPWSTEKPSDKNEKLLNSLDTKFDNLNFSFKERISNQFIEHLQNNQTNIFTHPIEETLKIEENDEGSIKNISHKSNANFQNILKSFLRGNWRENEDLKNIAKDIFPPEDFEYQELETLKQKDKDEWGKEDIDVEVSLRILKI